MVCLRLFSFKRLVFALWQRRLQISVVLLLTALAILLRVTAFTLPLDRLLFDASQKFSSLPEADDIVIVEIDDKSIQALGRWPWSRQVHADFIQQLIPAQTRALVFDVIFADVDRQHPQRDQALAAAIKAQGQVVLPLYIEQLGYQGQLVEVLPAPLFSQAAAAKGHVHISHDEDGVVRSVFLREGVGTAYWPHLSLALYNLLQSPPGFTPPGQRASEHVETAAEHFISRDYLNYIPMPASDQGIVHLSYVDILQGNVPLTDLTNKILFVGAAAAGLGDVVTTPIGVLSGIEFNAWVFQALRHDRLISGGSDPLALVVNALSVLLGILLISRLPPRQSILWSSLLVLMLLVGSILLTVLYDFWLPVIAAVIPILLFVPIWSWVRLEMAMRYLRSELSEITPPSGPSQIQDASRKVRQRLAFLQHIEVVDSWSENDVVAKPHQNPTAAAEGLKKDSDGELASCVMGGRLFSARLNPELVNPSLWRAQITRVPVIERRKRVRGAELIAQTIEQLTRSKEEARHQQELVENSLSNLQDAIAVLNVFGEIKFVNSEFRRYLLNSESLDNQDVLTLLHPVVLKDGRTWAEIFHQVCSRNTEYLGEGSTVDRDWYCQCRWVVSDVESRDSIVITLTDITQLKKAEKKRLEALNFLSHDLRSPMVSMLAILSRYREAHTVDPALLEPLESLVQKNLSYANSFLQLSRAEALQTSQLFWSDLHAVLDAAQSHGLIMAEAKGIRLEVSRVDEDAWVLADTDLLERALLNLLSNAIKYSPQNSTIVLALGRREDEWVFAVTDQGAGIEHADQSQLFQRFSRLPSGQGEMGVGLGLYFVDVVARLHQGYTAVTSELGKGSRFELCLPYQIVPDDVTD